MYGVGTLPDILAHADFEGLVFINIPFIAHLGLIDFVIKGGRQQPAIPYASEHEPEAVPWNDINKVEGDLNRESVGAP